MSERYDDDYYEVDDMDADIEAKKELIKEAKELQNEEDLAKALNKANLLQRQWRQIHSWESGYEEGLRQEFDENLDVIYAKRGELYDAVKEKKNDLIERAKALADNDNWKEATQKMIALMDEWKQAGNAGRKIDDELWERFRGARHNFFQKKDEYFQSLRSQFEQAKGKKEDLIEQAEQIKDSTQWKETGDKFRSLMDQWKEVGSAGREYEETLWKAFNDARQTFYANRDEYYKGLRDAQQQVFEKKNELVKEAKEILDQQQFTKEQTELMKAMNAKWKEIGNAGKRLEDQIWPEFKETLDRYFEELKQFNQNRHQNWLERMSEAKNNKLDQIQNQKRQIARLEEDMNGLVSESQRVEMEEEVKEKEAFIEQLES
ncbi:MAG: DUF349 domain-containing protein [Erysipelotrichaceae bacterium]|nr:DUF349 domain-containing protein [Erysipelotrichaceae bacterium]